MKALAHEISGTAYRSTKLFQSMYADNSIIALFQNRSSKYLSIYKRNHYWTISFITFKELTYM